ncbi:uncharacterized protein LOC144037809 isoform X2 [Vanacampus margaritifer]
MPSFVLVTGKNGILTQTGAARGTRNVFPKAALNCASLGTLKRSSNCECSCVIPEMSCRSSSALAPRNMAGFLAMQPCERLAQIPQESSVPLLCRAARSAPAVQWFLQGHFPVNAAASSLTIPETSRRSSSALNPLDQEVTFVQHVFLLLH